MRMSRVFNVTDNTTEFLEVLIAIDLTQASYLSIAWGVYGVPMAVHCAVLQRIQTEHPAHHSTGAVSTKCTHHGGKSERQ